MQIKIASRLRPFSHTPGITCLVPGTLCTVQIFPTMLRFQGKEHRLPFSGPIADFTVQQDLEKGAIHVFGRTPSGYMRYWIAAKGSNLTIEFEQSPVSIAPLRCPLPFVRPHSSVIVERLSLGMHRSQEWEGIHRRADLSEIFQHWLRLSQMLPETEKGPSLFLLEKIWEAKRDKREIIPAFFNLFQAHFHGILVPRLNDDQFQGIAPETADVENYLPYYLLKESGKCLRSLFIEEETGVCSLLPHLPSQFHAGRFTGVRLQNGDQIDFEWSKKLLRRLIWRTAETTNQQMVLRLQKSLMSFRVRRSLKDKGTVLSREDPLILRPNEILYLDRFQK
jgi:hypothetical protein